MAQRVNFKLAYKGETYKFASTFKDYELFTAITQHVDKIVNERPYEMFWTDDDSYVVLETSADLATAIDCAMSTRKSPTGIPCVRLTIGDCRKIEEDVKVEPQQSEVVQPDDAAKDIAAPAYDVAACDLHDPLPRIKEELLELFDLMIDHSWTDEIRADMKYFFSMPIEKQKLQYKSFARRIACKVAEMTGKVPAELRSQLLRLTPHLLTELFMSDWFDRIVEERIALVNDQDVADKDEKVHAIEDAASDVKLLIELHSNYKEEEERAGPVEDLFEEEEEEEKEREEEFDPTVQYEEENYEDRSLENSGESLESLERELQHSNFSIAMMDAMGNSHHSHAFVKRMMPQTAPPMDTFNDPNEWAELIKSINFVEDLKEFTGFDTHEKVLLSEITSEAIRFVRRTQKNYENREDEWLALLRDLHSPRPDGLAFILAMKWKFRLDNPFQDMFKLYGQKIEKSSKTIAYSPARFAARLIVAASARVTPKEIVQLLSKTKTKIVRSAEMEVLSEDEGMPMEQLPRTSSDPLPQYLTDWTDRQAAAIMKKGLSKLSLVLERLEEAATEVSAHEDEKETMVKKTGDEMPVLANLELVQSDVVDDADDFAVRERELKIREKAIQFKEHVFERQVAAFQVKMDEFEKKFDELEKRVEENEEKADIGYIDEELKEMNERLKTLELHGTEKI